MMHVSSLIITKNDDLEECIKKNCEIYLSGQMGLSFYPIYWMDDFSQCKKTDLYRYRIHENVSGISGPTYYTTNDTVEVITKYRDSQYGFASHFSGLREFNIERADDECIYIKTIAEPVRWCAQDFGRFTSGI